MFIPIWLLVLAAVLVGILAAWSFLLARDRNPLPFPDRGSRIFSAVSAEAKDAVVSLLATHGVRERFQFNTDGVLRSIMWDGTIINHASPDVLRKLGSVSASIGLVSKNPAASAHDAATFLRSRGFESRVVLDAEPELPIAFVVSEAMPGTVINFRRHVIHLPRPQPPSRSARGSSGWPRAAE